jgi:hypothetical protein
MSAPSNFIDYVRPFYQIWGFSTASTAEISGAGIHATTLRPQTFHASG